MENNKTEQSLSIINSIQETLNSNETALTYEESVRIKNTLTNIKLCFSKISSLEKEVSKNIAEIRDILNAAQLRITK